MANGKIDAAMVSNGLELINNLSKVTANVTTPKAPDQKTYREGDKFDQPHSQTVEVKVGNPDQTAPKPVVVHEKKETHIHKPFPEGRQLTTEECEVEKLRIQLEYEAKKDNLAYLAKMDEERNKARREREAEERKERERRREENKKSNRKLLIFGGAVLAGLVGVTAYGIYTDSRRSCGSRLALQQPSTQVNAIPVEGSVK